MKNFINKGNTDVHPSDVDGVQRQGDIGILDNDLKADNQGRPIAEQVHASGISDEATHTSSKLNTLGQAGVQDEVTRRNMAATLQEHGKHAEEIAQLMALLDPEDETQYVNARYFEQQGARKGFTLYASLGGEETFPIQFDNGIYVTSSVQIVDAIHRTINNRRANVGAHIVEISAARYEGLLNAYAQAERFRGTNGPVTTQVAGGGGRAPAELEDENRKLREELDAMKSQLTNSSGVIIGSEEDTGETGKSGTKLFGAN